ncbi:hypothetical protein SAMN05216343_102117 [Oscillibacter sp. PC13]|nr:hypothetical protein SAMN05216343_102117 [Oscillibacter sp. PC13]
MFGVMPYEKTHMEAIRLLDSFDRSGRRSFRMADTKRNTTLHRNGYKAAFIAAQYGVSDCLDDSIRINGYRNRPYL